MSQKTRFWLIRHAVVTETQGKVYGQGDVNCDCSDTAQCAWLAKHLPSDAISIASALKRTHQTHAAVVAEGFDSPIIARLSDLNEQCFGAWEGLSYDEIQAQYGASSQKFWLAPAGRRPESSPDRIGESFFDLTQRTSRALNQLAEDYAGKNIVVFAHGGTIRAAIALAMGLNDDSNPDTLAPIFNIKVDNLSLSRIDHVTYTNDEKTSDYYWRIGLLNALNTPS